MDVTKHQVNTRSTISSSERICSVLEHVVVVVANMVGIFTTYDYKKTRMHSSRMRTARSSSRLGGGVSTRTPDQAHTPPDQVHPQDHAPPGPCTPPRPGTNPPVNRITHTCENITLPQLRCGR